MPSSKRSARANLTTQTLVIINVSLLLISTILLLNIFGVSVTNIGFAIQDTFDSEDASCFAIWQDQTSEINLDICCGEARKQLSCDPSTLSINGIETDILCQTGESSLSYALTSKAQRYCERNY